MLKKYKMVQQKNGTKMEQNTIIGKKSTMKKKKKMEVSGAL